MLYKFIHEVICLAVMIRMQVPLANLIGLWHAQGWNFIVEEMLIYLYKEKILHR
jgi:hypothetical protein